MDYYKTEQRNRLILKKISNIIKGEEKLNFLSKCVELKVVPETLKIKQHLDIIRLL